MKNWLSRTLIREACLRVQDNLETAVEYLPRPRQPRLSGSIRSGVIGSALHQPKWLPFSPASTSKLFAGMPAPAVPQAGPPVGSVAEMPENCMYGVAGKLAQKIETPLSLAYPAMLAVCS